MRNTILFILFLLGATITDAQNTGFTQIVRGFVLDEQSGNVLQNITVALEGATTQTSTDEKGYFKLLNVPIGRQTIRVTAIGYEDAFLQNIEVTSSKEVVLEIRLKEKVKKLDDVLVSSGRSKNRALNDAAVVSARQLSTDEAFRYAGTRNDPSRMAQNFAGVSGTNDGRNDIIIRGNSPAGVLWRMDGIDIPNPNHFSTLGSTGGPVSILNINTLKNSDFLTSAFPSQYGNAIAGVFDLRLRNGNNEKHEFIGQMGFNGIELGAEGPLRKDSKASYMVDYRYSLVAALQSFGLKFGTGSATPYYQDASFKINIPTKKMGTFSFFGIGGESHIRFLPESQGKDNLYSSNDGSIRDRNFESLTGFLGMTHTYFFNTLTSGKLILGISGTSAKYNEDIVIENKPSVRAFYKKNEQTKYSVGYNLNKKFDAQNQLSLGFVADFSKLQLRYDYIKDGDSVLTNFVNSNETAPLVRTFLNFAHRFSDKLSTNIGLYYQQFTINNTQSFEPRWNLKYQLTNNQNLTFGVGLHSQLQPLEIYFYQTKNSVGQTVQTNRNLEMVKSWHSVLGYDINFSKYFRLKTEVYGQYIYNAAVEKMASNFSMLNAGADFGLPDKTNLVNEGKGYNYGVELTLERFLHKGLYYLFTTSLFQSKYKGSNDVWRNTAFNSNYVINALAGKEFKLNEKTTFGIDTKITITGGQRYTPFDITASQVAGYVVYKENQAYEEQQKAYIRWDIKFSYTRNLKKVTQKWYIDLQNFTGRENVYIRTLNPKTGAVSQINQMGFFPNINYQITF
jgi:CarboxypepD_reg-like domain/TonB-dependent Receptor Plug Domain